MLHLRPKNPLEQTHLNESASSMQVLLFSHTTLSQYFTSSSQLSPENPTASPCIWLRWQKNKKLTGKTGTSKLVIAQVHASSVILTGQIATSFRFDDFLTVIPAEALRAETVKCRVLGVIRACTSVMTWLSVARWNLFFAVRPWFQHKSVRKS